MRRLKEIIKSKITGVIKLIPMGWDVYLMLARKRLPIRYRGIYADFQQARIAVPSVRPNHYDIINKNKAANKEHENSALDNWFHDSDYPLLFWLTKLLKEKSRILELGGSVGHFFYTTNKYYLYPKEISWTIAELPEAVNLGRQIAKARGEERLKFIDSNDVGKCETADIFLTAGTLQYMEKTLPDILRGLAGLPVSVLVHNLPVHRKLAFWTLQNLGVCEVPYRIYSLDEFCLAMKALGYELITIWNNARTIEIPFHRNVVIEGYQGFYFRLTQAQRTGLKDGG